MSIPVGFTTFPGEIFRAPRSWVEKLYAHLIYFHEAGQGGHFAAWEEPQLLLKRFRAACAPLGDDCTLWEGVIPDGRRHLT